MMLILSTCFVPQLLWFRSVRLNVPLLWIISIIVNIGMWLERYVIVVTSLSQRLPAVLVGDVPRHVLGLRDLLSARSACSSFLLFLFIRFLPVISIAEMRELVHETHERDRRGQASNARREAS